MTPEEVALNAKKNASTKQQKDALEKKQIDEGMGRYLSDPSQGFNLYGDNAQKQHQVANLSQVGTMTGQNIFDVGSTAQDYQSSLQARRVGGDPVSQYMMAQRNRNMANLGRTFRGKGVAGGVAAAGMNQAQMEADTAVGAQMYKNDVANDKEFFNNIVKRNQKLTGEAIAGGAEQGLADNMSVEVGGGITVICTELYSQGLMDEFTFARDGAFGSYIRATDPYCYVGYYAWATEAVKLMQRWSWFTTLVSWFALPWAEYMAVERTDTLKRKFGWALMTVGRPVCRVIGKAIIWNLRRV